MLESLSGWADYAWAWTVVVLFLALGAWETLRPARRPSLGMAERWFTNLGLYAVNAAIIGLLAPEAFAVLVVGDTGHAWRPGSLIMHAGGPWAVLVAGFLFLDLYAYWMHWLEHRIFLLWRFHSVHHSDTEMDASTTLRHHPLEYITSTCIGAGVFAVMGIPEWVFPLYAIVSITISLIQHGNIRLPERVERVVGAVLITPGLHQIHHSVLAADFDSNYGTVLTIWDRLFGTYRREPARTREGLMFGVQPFTGKRYARLHWAWLLPFAIRSERPVRLAQTSEAD
ncbi:MAG: sterol desaturase family protein [Acetobacteraceae bacterium]|nr:sterol desaturase family protein [Acetobacteraceae bacterium]